MSTTFNTFDLIFIAFAFIFIFVAFFRGFVKEVCSLIIWVIALFISYFGAPLLADLFSSYSSNKLVLDIVSRLILFIVVFFILMFSTASFVEDLKDKMPTLLDRSLGVFYGICKTLLIFGVFYSMTLNCYALLLGKNQDPKADKVPSWLSEARFGNIIRISGEVVDPVVNAFITAVVKNMDKPDFLPKSLDPQTLDGKVDEIINQDSSKKNKDSKVKDPSLNSLEDDIEKETGYSKKDIEKMNRLIDVVGKINN